MASSAGHAAARWRWRTPGLRRPTALEDLPRDRSPAPSVPSPDEPGDRARPVRDDAARRHAGRAARRRLPDQPDAALARARLLVLERGPAHDARRDRQLPPAHAGDGQPHPHRTRPGGAGARGPRPARRCHGGARRRAASGSGRQSPRGCAPPSPAPGSPASAHGARPRRRARSESAPLPTQRRGPDRRSPASTWQSPATTTMPGPPTISHIMGCRHHGPLPGSWAIREVGWKWLMGELRCGHATSVSSRNDECGLLKQR